MLKVTQTTLTAHWRGSRPDQGDQRIRHQFKSIPLISRTLQEILSKTSSYSMLNSKISHQIFKLATVFCLAANFMMQQILLEFRTLILDNPLLTGQK